MRGAPALSLQAHGPSLPLLALCCLSVWLPGCVAPTAAGLRPDAPARISGGAASTRDGDVLEAPTEAPNNSHRVTSALTESNAGTAPGPARDASKWVIGGLSLADSTKQAVDKFLKEFPKARWRQTGASYALPNGKSLRWITGVHLIAGTGSIETGYNTLWGREELGKRSVKAVIGVSPMNPKKVVLVSIEKSNGPEDAPTKEAFTKSLVEKYGEPDFSQGGHTAGNVAGLWNGPDTDTLQVIWFEKGANQFRDWRDTGPCYAFASSAIGLAREPMSDYSMLSRTYQSGRLRRCGRMMTFEMTAIPGNKVVEYRGLVIDTEALVDSHFDMVNETHGRADAADEAQQKNREGVKPEL